MFRLNFHQLFIFVLLSLGLLSCGGGDTNTNTTYSGSATSTFSFKPQITLSSNTPATGNSFGTSIAYSPDGNSLIIGEFNGNTNTIENAGTAQLFTKTITKQLVTWVRVQILTASSPETLFQFGASVSFSVDGKMLAVGEGSGGFDNFGSGSVQLFKNTGTQWQHSVRFNPAPSVYLNKFGLPVVYSPVNNELAVGESNGDLENIKDAGLVTIFDISEGSP